MVTAAGCSQLWSPPSSQASPSVQRSLPAIQQLPATPVPSLASSDKLPSLLEGILTPVPESVDIAKQVIPDKAGEPVIISTPTAYSQSGTSYGAVATATPRPQSGPGTTASTPVQPSATPLATPVSSGIPSLVMRPSVSALGVGQETDIQVLLTSAPTGVSGFILDMEIVNPGVAEIVTGVFPNFSLGTSSTLPDASARLQAVDLSQDVNPSPDEVTLANIGVRGLYAGTTEIRIVIVRVDDDNGLPVDPEVQSITLTVQ